LGDPYDTLVISYIRGGFTERRAREEAGLYINQRDLVIAGSAGMLDLFNWLEQKTQWLTSPASSQYHASFDGGLIYHSVLVANMTCTLTQVLGITDQLESARKVALLHDIGKTVQYERTPEEAWVWVDEDTLVSMTHALRSLHMISRYAVLSDIEWQAIYGHDGQYVKQNRSLAMKETPLTLVLHWADVWCARFLEG